MRYLIDTHVLIWYLEGDEKLAPGLRKELDDEGNIVVISIASLWEIAIKRAKNKEKIDFKITLPEIEAYIFGRDFMLLNIAFKHLHLLLELPMHHDDPFDRLIISQAISENLTLISVDKHFKFYSVNLIS